MFCEICGEPIKGKPMEVFVEGSKLIVCQKCVSFKNIGTSHSLTIREKQAQLKPVGKQRRFRLKPRKNDIEEKFVFKENYGRIIRALREKMGLKQEELAKKLNVKPSVIKKLESEKMFPEPSLVKKLESFFNTTLLEPVEADSKEILKGKGPLTLGDIINVKMREKTRKK